MAINKYTTNLMELLPICMSHQDLMLSIPEWLCQELRDKEFEPQGAVKNIHSSELISSRNGYRPRRLDTLMGTLYLMVSKVRAFGYIPLFITVRNFETLARPVIFNI